MRTHRGSEIPDWLRKIPNRTGTGGARSGAGGDFTTRFAGIPVGAPPPVELPAEITWTAIPTPSGGDKIVYCDASRPNDAGDGLSPATAKRTVAAAVALLTIPSGDQLLFRRGQTWTAEVLGLWSNQGGVSAARPLVFGSYDTGARPRFDVSGANFFRTHNIFAGATSHIWFDSLDITDSSYTGSGGNGALHFFSTSTSGCDDILVQNCRFNNLPDAVQFQGSTETLGGLRHTNITVRGCTFDTIWCTTAIQQCTALYYQSVDGGVIEFNNFDRCSYTAGSQYWDQKHDLYVHNNCTDVAYDCNINTRGGDSMLRCGGSFTFNVSSRSIWAHRFGLGTNPSLQTATGAYEDNVVLDVGNSAYSNLATGLWAGNLNAASIRRNIFVKANTSDAKGMWLQEANTEGITLALTNCFVEDNIIHDFGCVGVTMTPFTALAGWTGNTFLRNYVQSPNNSTVWGGGGTHDIVVNFNTGMTSTHWSMQGNRLRRNGATQTEVYTYGSYPAFAIGSSDWNTNFADGTTTSDAVSYVNASGATLGQYYVFLGFADLGSEAANHDAMVALITANERDSWQPNYTAPYVVARIKACMTPV